MARNRDSNTESDADADTPDANAEAGKATVVPDASDRPESDGPDAVSAEKGDVEDAEVVDETPPGGEADDLVDETGADAISAAAEETSQDFGDAPSQANALPEADDAPIDSVMAADAPADDPDPAADGASQADATPETDPAEDAAPDGGVADVRGPDARDAALAAAAVAATNTKSLFEPAPEPAPEPAAKTPPSPPPAARSSGGMAVVPLLIGGLVAGMIGFIAAQYTGGFGSAPEGPTPADNAAAIDAARAEIAKVSDQTQSIGAQVTALAERDIAAEISAATEAAAAPLRNAQAAVEAQVSDLADRLQGVATRLEAVAMRPEPPTIEPGQFLDPSEFDDALEEFRAEVNAAIAEATAEIEEARGEAERISEQAFEAEQAAVSRAAWGEVQTALEAGEPYAEALVRAREHLSIELPEPVVAAADDGIATLGALQADFPDAARAALNASVRTDMGEGAMDRLTAFLRVQTGVRSLAPREGDDPDAVLSRAEAAVRAGDLEAAMAELEALPEAGQAEVAGWIARARTRLDVLAAASDVTDALGSN